MTATECLGWKPLDALIEKIKELLGIKEGD